jgi:hypothetical protein
MIGGLEPSHSSLIRARKRPFFVTEEFGRN